MNVKVYDKIAFFFLDQSQYKKIIHQLTN